MINGYGRPVFEIVNPDGDFVKKIILPYCNVTNGLAEDFIPFQTVHSFHNGRIAVKDYGYRKVWRLDYTEFIEESGKELIDELYKHQKDGMTLNFYPTENARQLRQPVLLLKGYTSRQVINSDLNNGFELIELELTSVNLLPENLNVDIDNLTITPDVTVN